MAGWQVVIHRVSRVLRPELTLFEHDQVDTCRAGLGYAEHKTRTGDRVSAGRRRRLLELKVIHKFVIEQHLGALCNQMKVWLVHGAMLSTRAGRTLQSVAPCFCLLFLCLHGLAEYVGLECQVRLTTRDDTAYSFPIRGRTLTCFCQRSLNNHRQHGCIDCRQQD